jgi:hypothetical protein
VHGAATISFRGRRAETYYHRMAPEDENLRILSVFHYVVAGVAAAFSLFPVFHVVLGTMMVLGRLDDGGSPPPAVFGWFFIGIGVFFILVGMTFAACYAFAGRFLSRRRHYMYCLIMAGIGCMFVPFGTVLGVFTIVELQKDSVRAMFTPAAAR